MNYQLKKAMKYYDMFSHVYDWLSPKWYYHKARSYAIRKMEIQPGNTILNLPCGTGQNFEYFQEFLHGSGMVVGVDYSKGMLKKAAQKIGKYDWKNISIFRSKAEDLNVDWLNKYTDTAGKVDAVLCDLGLSGFPAWKVVIDNMMEILKPGGRLVIMDWYIPTPTLRGRIVRWIGKGEVDRKIYQYLKTTTNDFRVNTSFNRGGVFVAVGIKND